MSLAKAAPRKFAVLLLAHGTPETIEEIPEYLKNVVSGRAIPQHVVEEIQHRYAQIGKSPLTEWTFKQARLLEARIGMPVYVGMRNWRPYISDTMRQLRADGVTDVIAICLAPQNSRTSVGLYRRAVLAEAGNSVRVHFIDAWASHPKLIAAFAERLQPAWQAAQAQAGENAVVLFTAHSVPLRTVQAQVEPEDAAEDAGETVPGAPVRPTRPERSYALGANVAAGPDPYADESLQTAALVAEAMEPAGLTARNWQFAFQSQGASGGPWIGPTVEETLQSLAAAEHRAVVLQPIGFLCDHVEILYDIDIAFQQLARELGIQLTRPESLNDSPLLIDALANLAQRGLRALEPSLAAAAIQ
jgi:ferrochelatase